MIERRLKEWFARSIQPRAEPSKMVELLFEKGKIRSPGEQTTIQEFGQAFEERVVRKQFVGKALVGDREAGGDFADGSDDSDSDDSGTFAAIVAAAAGGQQLQAQRGASSSSSSLSPGKLVDMLAAGRNRRAILLLLYHLSSDERIRKLFTYTDAIPIVMQMMINFPGDHLGKELVALAVNLSDHVHYYHGGAPAPWPAARSRGLGR